MFMTVTDTRSLFAGIDLGGTNIKVGIFDGQLGLRGKVSISTQVELGAESIVERMGTAVEDVLVQSGLDIGNLVAAGIGSPGVIDIEKGVVIQNANLGFRDVPLRDMLARRLGRPAVLENDANITCWAEFVAGKGKGCKDMILITLGTGIGGGVVSNGELVHGFENKAAELGHVIIYPNGRQCGCGQKGCVEAYSSANATAERALEAIRAGGDSSLKKVLDTTGTITCKDVYEHSYRGDKLAREVTDGTAKALGLFCVNLLHFTGPERILFFGGMTGAGDTLLVPIRRYFQKYIWTIQQENVEIDFASLGDNAGMIGAAALARHLSISNQL